MQVAAATKIFSIKNAARAQGFGFVTHLKIKAKRESFPADFNYIILLGTT